MPKSVGDFKENFLLLRVTKVVGPYGFCLEMFAGHYVRIEMILFLTIG
jgi:hypothetical protein